MSQNTADSVSRRTVLKHGAVVSGGLVVGVSGTALAKRGGGNGAKGGGGVAFSPDYHRRWKPADKTKFEILFENEDATLTQSPNCQEESDATKEYQAYKIQHPSGSPEGHFYVNPNRNVNMDPVYEFHNARECGTGVIHVPRGDLEREIWKVNYKPSK